MVVARVIITCLWICVAALALVLGFFMPGALIPFLLFAGLCVGGSLHQATRWF